MINTREIGESREFGALGIISRKSCSRDTEGLLVDDVSKEEMPAGLRTYFSGEKKLRSFPGGGRGIHRDEKGYERLETLEETIRAEVSEEFGLFLSGDQITDGATQISPFVVAQRKGGVVNQIAVTSKLIQLESLDVEQKKHISKKIKMNEARWVSMSKLSSYYEFLLKNKSLVSETQFRIIAHVASYIFFKTISGWSDEAVQNEIGRMNRETNGVLVGRPDEGLSRSSAFSSSGDILTPDQLPSDDAVFLYGIIK